MDKNKKILIGGVLVVVIFVLLLGTGIITQISERFESPEGLFFGVEEVECDLSKCDDVNVVRACGNIYRQHGISDEQIMQCLQTYEASPRGLSLSITSCNIWAYDVNNNCYIDDIEVLKGIDDWQLGFLPLECQIDLINVWESQTKNPSCYVPPPTTVPSPTTTLPPTCTPSCESWSSGCDTSRTCTRSDCSTYTETRSVDYCSCNAHCPDGACNCGETCSSCQVDCGTCPGPPTCPNGQSTQTEYRLCTASNDCEGSQSRDCTNGIWTGWGYCTTSLEKCWDGSCQVTCPPEPTTTTLAPTTEITITPTTIAWDGILTIRVDANNANGVDYVGWAKEDGTLSANSQCDGSTYCTRTWSYTISKTGWEPETFRVRGKAFVNGAWRQYSTYKTITMLPPVTTTTTPTTTTTTPSTTTTTFPTTTTTLPGGNWWEIWNFDDWWNGILRWMGLERI